MSDSIETDLDTVLEYIGMMDEELSELEEDLTILWSYDDEDEEPDDISDEVELFDYDENTLQREEFIEDIANLSSGFGNYFPTSFEREDDEGPVSYDSDYSPEDEADIMDDADLADDSVDEEIEDEDIDLFFPTEPTEGELRSVGKWYRWPENRYKEY